MSDFHINFKEDKRTWDAFVLTSPQRSIFVLSKFLDSLLADYDLVTCYESGRIVAGAVIIYSEKGEPINSTFPFTQYQGMLLADNTKKAVHSKITHELKVVRLLNESLAERFDEFYLSNSWHFKDLRSFQWFNFHEPNSTKFKINLRYAGVLDLSGFATFKDYLISIRSSRQREYKKALKILAVEDSKDISKLEMLYVKTFMRQNLNMSEEKLKLLRSITSSALDGGYGKLSVVLHEGYPVSAQLTLHDDRSTFLLIGGNDPDYRGMGSSTFIILNSIREAFDRGFHEIDFCGANSPARGDFKASFNADVMQYYECVYGKQNV